MSVMRLVEPLLQGLELTPGQLAELRAIDSMYQSGRASGSTASLDDLVFTRVHDMLHHDQRAIFDRKLAAGRAGEMRDTERPE